MIHAKEAARLMKEMTPEERFESVRDKIGKKTQSALDKKIRAVIAACQTKVELVLAAKDCTESDSDLTTFLQGCGYKQVQITSDFPAYCESYVGTTTFKFIIPKYK